jgi:hypothetical protein
MKKVIGSMSGIIFAVFGVAVLGLLMSLTYGALQKLFPGNFTNQMWGLVMFDIAAICWALGFVFKSETVIQYATAGIGFLVAFVGTLGMVAAEVMLSSDYVEGDDLGKWMVYGFVIVTAIHAALLYAHHFGLPWVHEKVNVGIARGGIVSEAIKQATQQLEQQQAELAMSIHAGIVDEVKRDLGLMPVQGTIFEPKKERGSESSVGIMQRMRNWRMKKNQTVTEQPAAAVLAEKPKEDDASHDVPFHDGDTSAGDGNESKASG